MQPFAYYEVRPVRRVWPGNHIEQLPFQNRDEMEAAGESPDFWTLYGRYENGEAKAIGDYDSFDAAYADMQSILAPLVTVREYLDEKPVRSPYESKLLASVEDILNQSTNEDRF